MQDSRDLLSAKGLPEPGSLSRGSRRKSGYVLIATSLGLLFLLGVAGLAVDIGRMYITKNEAQAYVDSAAVAAVTQLDGTSDGITNALAAVGKDSVKWRFDNAPFTNVTTTFGTSSTSAFVATPTDPTNYFFARVVVSVNVPMYLIRVLAGPVSTISAVATAGRSPITTFPGGEFPFSPYTRKGYPGAIPDDVNDPFGFKAGNMYTLHWGSPGNKTNCGTDATVPTLAGNGSIRCYCCAGSASSIRDAIVGEATQTVTIGQPVPMNTAEKDTANATIGARVNYDTDATTPDYATYRANGNGNGVRVVLVPVNGGPPNFTTIGFAGFFLLPASSYIPLNGNDSACGQYIGTYVEGSLPPQGGAGSYRIRLFQ